MADRYVYLLILVGVMLALPGCCRSLVAAYDRDLSGCLERFPDDDDAAAACGDVVRNIYRPMLKERGCD